MKNSMTVPVKFENSPVKKIILGNIQDKGARPYQEDSFGFTPLNKSYVEKYGLTAVVADGMGGLANGDKISSCVVSEIINEPVSTEQTLPLNIFFTRMFNSVNRRICSSGYSGGATASAVYCCRKGVYFCSTGDSRIYLFRSGRIFRMTVDFDYMNTLLNGVIEGTESLEEALEDPQKDSLHEYMGADIKLTTDVNIRPFVPLSGDKLLICSDGVYNALEENELAASLAGSAQDAADDILRRVLEKHYENQDNFTAVILEFV